jgi:mitogen-activated protein kinase kinase
MPKAIVEGAPPDLPATGYSDAARQFVRSCLKKTPKLRPTYSALLQHPWLAPLAKPTIIEEESDDEADHHGVISFPTAIDGVAVPNGDAHGPRPPPEEKPAEDGGIELPPGVVDEEVARWALGALARRRKGLVGRAAKPALHAAPLDAVRTPGPRPGAVQSSEAETGG